MKKRLLIVIFLGISYIPFAQNQNDEVSTLKKQVVSLKQASSRHEVQAGELKKSVKILQDSLTTALKRYDVKLKTFEDTINANAAVVHFVKNRYGLVDHSLKTRKTVFYIAFIVSLILLIVIYFLMVNKLKAINSKIEGRVSNLKDLLEVDAVKTKTEIQSQIAALRTELAAVREEMDKKLKEAKK